MCKSICIEFRQAKGILPKIIVFNEEDFRKAFYKWQKFCVNVIVFINKRGNQFNFQGEQWKFPGLCEVSMQMDIGIRGL